MAFVPIKKRPTVRTAILAARSGGKPYTPVENAGKATERIPSSKANSSERL